MDPRLWTLEPLAAALDPCQEAGMHTAGSRAPPRAHSAAHICHSTPAGAPPASPAACVTSCFRRCAGPARPNLDDCYFHRLSSCTVADTGLNATARRGAEILNLKRDQRSHKAGAPAVPVCPYGIRNQIGFHL